MSSSTIIASVVESPPVRHCTEHKEIVLRPRNCSENALRPLDLYSERLGESANLTNSLLANAVRDGGNQIGKDPDSAKSNPRDDFSDVTGDRGLGSSFLARGTGLASCEGLELRLGGALAFKNEAVLGGLSDRSLGWYCRLARLSVWEHRPLALENPRIV